jgi:hypothetical protein
MILCAVMAMPLCMDEVAATQHGGSSLASPLSAATPGNDNAFSLTRCIEVALERNPDIAAVRWDIAVAEARHDAARAAFWPQLSLEGGYLRYVDSQRLIAASYNGELGVFDNDLFRGDLMARINLYAEEKRPTKPLQQVSSPKRKRKGSSGPVMN